MNIFWLALNPERSARMACDRHIVKMITEHTQMLSTALHELGCKKVLMKPTHANHPCNKWLLEEFANFAYLVELNEAYHNEYLFRYRVDLTRTHKSHDLMEETLDQYSLEFIRKKYEKRGCDNSSANSHVFRFPEGYITIPPQCVPDNYKITVGGSRERKLKAVMSAYRKYYQIEKVRFATYKKRKIPVFMKEYLK